MRVRTIAGSFALALLLDFMPWADLRLMPEFVALVLTFWCVRQPRLVGLGVGWTLGLLIDAGNGVLLGQHALAYSLLAFLAISLSRRILWFGPLQQALHVAALLLFSQGVTVLVRLAAGAELPGWQVLIGPVIGAVLWPLVSFLLLIPQRHPVEPQEPRAL
ncbi:MAG: rod shape-determining protein MreD [Bacteroidota bacterium]